MIAGITETTAIVLQETDVSASAHQVQAASKCVFFITSAEVMTVGVLLHAGMQSAAVGGNYQNETPVLTL